MNHHLSFAISQAHQQDLHRRAEAARIAAEVPRHSRIGRIRFTVPSLAFGRRIAAVWATIASV